MQKFVILCMLLQLAIRRWGDMTDSVLDSIPFSITRWNLFSL